MSVLWLARRLVSMPWLPGKYVLADIAARLLGPSNNMVEGHLGAYSVRFDLRDQLQRYMYFGLYDQPETRLLHEILKPGDLFVDAGANVGYYSLVASQLVGASGQVHAFEPIAENVAVLNRAIVDNGITNIDVSQTALGQCAGTLELFVPDKPIGNSGWASVVPSDRRPNVVAVQQIAIDDYLAERAIDEVSLVKLDIEGSELDALQGMVALLDAPNAPDLFCEVNPWLLNRLGKQASDLPRFLVEHGYTLYVVQPHALKLVEPHHEFEELVNLFCTKHPEQWA